MPVRSSSAAPFFPVWGLVFPLFFPLVFSLNARAAQSLCDKIINDFVVEAKVGKSLENLNSFFNHKTSPAEEALADYHRQGQKFKSSIEDAKKQLLNSVTSHKDTTALLDFQDRYSSIQVPAELFEFLGISQDVKELDLQKPFFISNQSEPEALALGKELYLLSTDAKALNCKKLALVQAGPCLELKIHADKLKMQLLPLVKSSVASTKLHQTLVHALSQEDQSKILAFTTLRSELSAKQTVLKDHADYPLAKTLELMENSKGLKVDSYSLKMGQVGPELSVLQKEHAHLMASRAGIDQLLAREPASGSLLKIKDELGQKIKENENKIASRTRFDLSFSVIRNERNQIQGILFQEPINLSLTNSCTEARLWFETNISPNKFKLLLLGEGESHLTIASQRDPGLLKKYLKWGESTTPSLQGPPRTTPPTSQGSP